MTIEIEYKNSLDDINAFAGYHFDHSETAKRTIQRTRYLSVIGMLIILALISRIARLYTYLFVGVPVAVIYFIQFPNMMKKIGANSVKRSYMEGRNIGLFEPRKISLTPERILVTSAYGESAVNWRTVEKILENDKFIFMYITSVSAFIIPKQSFAGSMADDFVLQAKQYLEEAKKESGGLAHE